MDPHATGCLVDEQFGAPKGMPEQAKERGLLLAMPVEKSGQNEFDFQYGDDFGAHIEKFDPDFSKVLVRYNPDGDAEMNKRQTERLKRLADWLHEHDRKFLFELLVPAEEAPARAGRRRHRPLRRRAAPRADAARDRRAPGRRRRGGHLEDRGDRHAGGLRADRRRPAAATAATAWSAWCSAAAPTTTRSTTGCARARPVEGYAGFAIGRTIWWDALKGFLDGSLEREDAAEQIADNYLRFVQVYREAAREHAAA